MLINFSWLVPERIAGTGQPGGCDCDLGIGREKLEADLDLLQKQGVRAIVTLTEQSLKEESVRAKDMAYLHLPIMDMHPPVLEDIFRFMDFVKTSQNEERPVVVHCGAGMGRTGTMLACYLVGQGYAAPDALAEVRQRRPGSVETMEQEAVIHEYANHLKDFPVDKKALLWS